MTLLSSVFARTAAEPVADDMCYSIDIIDRAVTCSWRESLTEDPLADLTLLAECAGNLEENDDELEVLETAIEDRDLTEKEDEMVANLADTCYTIEADSACSVEVKVPERKPLPSNLKYVFLDDTERYPAIVSAKLNDDQLSALMCVLKKNRKALGYSLDDIKGISPDICMHRIELEEDHKPCRQGQRKLNPKMQEVVMAEVMKLLDAGIIYSVSNSKWVSPVQVVPKKGGTTVVQNEKNEINTNSSCDRLADVHRL